jgi:hypothetical protein
VLSAAAEQSAIGIELHTNDVAVVGKLLHIMLLISKRLWLSLMLLAKS